MTKDNVIRDGIIALMALLFSALAIVLGSTVTYAMLRIIKAPTWLWVTFIVSLIFLGFGLLLGILIPSKK